MIKEQPPVAFQFSPVLTLEQHFSIYFLLILSLVKKIHHKKNGSDSFVSMNTALGPTLRVGPDPQASVAFSVTAHHPPAGS